MGRAEKSNSIGKTEKKLSLYSKSEKDNRVKPDRQKYQRIKQKCYERWKSGGIDKENQNLVLYQTDQFLSKNRMKGEWNLRLKL